MRKYRPVPAIEVSEESLRLIAGKSHALAELRESLAGATVDAYGDDEQLGGFAVMIRDNVQMPFETTVLGVQVAVTGIIQTESGIVADCVRDGQRQAVSVLDLPPPEPPPEGAQGIAAYRHWARFA